MFRCNHHHQGACYLSFVKVNVAKKKKSELSVKIQRCGQFGCVTAYIIRSWLVYACDTVSSIYA